MRERTIPLVSIVTSSITIIIFGCLALSCKNQNWLGVAAGALAVQAIICLSCDYFFPPKKGDIIRPPNVFTRCTAGIMGIVSGTLWILSSWPNIPIFMN